MKRTATTWLVALNVIGYLIELATHIDFESNESLLSHGALYGRAVLVDGQWWRIVSGAFMHDGIAHIALNMFALYQLGIFVESMAGSWRMLAIYAFSLLGGGLAVVYFSPNEVTVGASGAIFGLFGALLAFGLRLGDRGRAIIAQTIPVLLLNLVFTFAVPFISKSGHLGGLACGFLAGLVFFATRRRVATVVTDAATGESAQADYLAPNEPNEPADFPRA